MQISPVSILFFSIMSSRRLEDVFSIIIFCLPRRLQDVFVIRLPQASSRRLQDVFKTSSQDVFKTSSRRLQHLFARCLLPANICLDEDVFKTSWSRRICWPQPYVFRRRLQDVLVKTNIFVLAIRLQDFFKTFSRRLQDVLQKGLQAIFKTSSRRIIKVNCFC